MLIRFCFGEIFLKASRVSIIITAPKYEEKDLKDEYEINQHEILGSGQFGQVYGGICKLTNQPVAIKIIHMSRFSDIKSETNIFQNEITLLYNINHPGIVRLFALFNEVDKVSSFITHYFKRLDLLD